jgi:RNase adaptor protein for sRNA GlmZ degradation
LYLSLCAVGRRPELTKACFRDEVVRLMMAAYDQGGGSLLLVVACPGGTHRSVAVAEIIKKKLLRRGVTTVHLNHVHRVRRPGDAV